jgi:hypothetical protein
MSGSRETRISSATTAALRRNPAIVGGREIEKLLASFGVIHDRTHRDRNFHIRTVFAGSVTSFAVFATVGRMLGIEAKMQQRVVMCAGFEDYVAAMPAVASAGTAARHKLLAPERQTAVAAVAGFHGNDHFIDKHWNSK